MIRFAEDTRRMPAPANDVAECGLCMGALVKDASWKLQGLALCTICSVLQAAHALDPEGRAESSEEDLEEAREVLLAAARRLARRIH
jgi:hypothetical protein